MAEPRAVVAFDALGTLFDLGPLAKSVELRRVLHHAASLTLAGEWAPFADLARAVDPKLPAELAELDPADDARAALERVQSAGVDAWILTNGGAADTARLLDRGGLTQLVARVRSVEEVRRYKPDPAVYRLLPRGSVLVAAHGWDVAGAERAGYAAVWVDREEGEWPLPLDGPALRASDLSEAAGIAVNALGGG